MSITKTTLLTNVFNEEYLLPFWLHHHKNMFDEIIIIDYNSTDKSMDICKSICPDCIIIKTRNEYFDAEKIDEEFMSIENQIEGIKIVLNTTEFLICEKSIKNIFVACETPIPTKLLSAHTKVYTFVVVKLEPNAKLYPVFVTVDGVPSATIDQYPPPEVFVITSFICP